MDLKEAKKIVNEIVDSNRAWMMKSTDEVSENMYLRDIEALETVLSELERYEKYYAVEINLFDKYIERKKVQEILDRYHTLSDVIADLEKLLEEGGIEK